MATKKLIIPDRYIDTGARFTGGYGEVLVLHDSLLDRDVVLKTILDIDDEDQLRDEVSSISAIHSKHVLQIYDLLLSNKGKIQGFIAECIPGKDLSTFATEEPYSLARFLGTVYQLASGIADIHHHGIVHRDIKLNNVKRDAEGIVKIFDFGLSCVHQDHETMVSRGTWVYRAPEAYSPPLTIEKSLDTYAFGVCCWLLLTASPPKELLEIPPQKSGRVPSISGTAKGLPREVSKYLDAALDTDPASRPEMQTIRDVIGLHLLQSKHRAQIIGDTNVYTISSPGQAITIGSDPVGKITITYDGLYFRVSAIKGDVFVNNRLLEVGNEVPASCVITIGGDDRGPYRTFLEFNVSNPEVVL